MGILKQVRFDVSGVIDDVNQKVGGVYKYSTDFILAVFKEIPIYIVIFPFMSC